jgi:hypothetical protein
MFFADTIETGGTKHAATIKTHHNRVDGITQLIQVHVRFRHRDGHMCKYRHWYRYTFMDRHRLHHRRIVARRNPVNSPSFCIAPRLVTVHRKGG